jgi:ABC-2 type transport system permease protein
MTEPFRTLRWSTWLGWQVESNWTDWRLFFLYLVIKPVTGSLMLVCMYFAARQAVPTRVPAEFLPYVYVSNACFGLVGTVMLGMSYVVMSDRETYRMLKYIYVSPAQFQAYFVGRGLARGFEGLLGGAITLAVGMSIPGIRDAVNPGTVDPLWLVVFLAVGGVLLWSCGMILASAMLNMSRSGMFIAEGISGLVYFLSGVVFPLTILPVWLQAVSLSLPTTYWLEGMRRALTGPAPAGSPLAGSPLAGWSNADLALALVGTTVVLTAVSQWFYRWSVRKAWRNGKIEEATGM